MLTSNHLQNLTGPSIYDAGGVEGRTARAWAGTNGLRLGDRGERDTGHPRYGLADAARLTLMRFLTERLAMRAQAAVDLTNASFNEFAELAAAELTAIDNPGEPPAGKRYIMAFDRVDGLHKPAILPHDDAWIANEKRGPILEARVDLREVVRLARDRLANELGQSTSGLRHDFADAPEPR